MKLNEFMGMITPFINVRGGDAVYPFQSLSVAINNAVQDMYNFYDWSWLVTTTPIKQTGWEDSGHGYYIQHVGPIKRFMEFSVQDGEGGYVNLPLTECKTIPELLTDPENSIMTDGEEYLYSFVKHEGVITYRKDYTWDLFQRDYTTEIPLPNKFIPALYYLVLSQIDLIEVMQADDQSYSNYGKYMNKIKTLAENDVPMVAHLEGGNRP